MSYAIATLVAGQQYTAFLAAWVHSVAVSQQRELAGPAADVVVAHCAANVASLSAVLECARAEFPAQRFLLEEMCLEHPHPAHLSGNHERFLHTFHWFGLFKLTRYRAVLFIDVDAVVIAPMNELLRTLGASERNGGIAIETEQTTRSAKPPRRRRLAAPSSLAVRRRITGRSATVRQATVRQATVRQATGSQGTGSHGSSSGSAPSEFIVVACVKLEPREPCNTGLVLLQPDEIVHSQLMRALDEARRLTPREYLLHDQAFFNLLFSGCTSRLDMGYNYPSNLLQNQSRAFELYREGRHEKAAKILEWAYADEGAKVPESVQLEEETAPPPHTHTCQH